MTARVALRHLARETPPSRDRFLDALRGGSILVVVLGHWLMAVVEWRDGRLHVTNLLAIVTELQPLTWLLQVMPIFFFVGGAVNMRAVDRAGPRWQTYLGRRLHRLLQPVVPFAVVWLAVAFVLRSTGTGGAAASRVARVVAQPLWFLAVYLLVVAVAPVALALHRRLRWRAPLVLAVAALAVDVAADNVAGLGWVNYGVVFLFAHQIGFFYGDGTLSAWSPARLVAAAAAGALALGALTAGPYPTSMVGVTGEARSNMSPPSVCIIALTVFQVALVLLARPAITKALARERVWVGVVAVNVSIMTIFLWHLSALAIVGVALLPTRAFPQPTVGSVLWWLLRAPWLVSLTIVLAVLVMALGSIERHPPTQPWEISVERAVVATSLTAAGFIVLALFGFARVVAAPATAALAVAFVMLAHSGHAMPAQPPA